jgi:hypothetical protein
MTTGSRRTQVDIHANSRAATDIAETKRSLGIASTKEGQHNEPLLLS